VRAYARVPTRASVRLRAWVRARLRGRLRGRVRAYGSGCVRAYACAYAYAYAGVPIRVRARRGVWGDDRPPKGSSRGLGRRTGGAPHKKVDRSQCHLD